MFYCIEGAPLLSNFRGIPTHILPLFPPAAPPRTSLPSPPEPASHRLAAPLLDHRSASLRWVVTIVALALLPWTSHRAARAQETSRSQSSPADMVARLDAARERLLDSVQHVRAKGRVSGWTQTPGTVREQVTLDAEFLLLRNGTKFHLELMHAARPDLTPPQPERVELVTFDGENIYTYSSSPNAARGGVFFEFSSSAVLRSTGFPFATLLNFWDDALSLKELDQRSLTLLDLGHGGQLLREDRATYIRQVYLGAGSEYDLQRVALRHPGAGAAFREHWLTWQGTGVNRFVQRYVVRNRYALRDAPAGQVIARQNEIEIQEFERDVQLDATDFSIASLRVPANTVFVDYRHNVKGKRAILIWNGSSLESSDSAVDAESP